MENRMFKPSVYVATASDTIITMAGSLMNMISFFAALSSGIRPLTMVVSARRITGSSEEKMLMLNDGSLSSGIGSAVNVSGISGFILLRVFAKIGPAITTVGMAMMIPYKRVLPMSAPNWSTSAVGEGCGGRNPCVTERAESMGSPM